MDAIPIATVRLSSPARVPSQWRPRAKSYATTIAQGRDKLRGKLQLVDLANDYFLIRLEKKRITLGVGRWTMGDLRSELERATTDDSGAEASRNQGWRPRKEAVAPAKPQVAAGLSSNSIFAILNQLSDNLDKENTNPNSILDASISTGLGSDKDKKALSDHGRRVSSLRGLHKLTRSWYCWD
ncbi:hypothetical protein F3Y22_tig00112490pilonHSYRG00019 [Hibiscus syriacus]|uniref:Uncharacterized protein n=1 Tax=Hibiscus syriacus TaxID=106335 RepID=A0A6A2Y9G5_HIBSY|nr:hypothetical protein F3Y22_tig00112490pilonHSYRG00019 [Hibiscus syriacus]